jgi:hypothetical protein
MNSFQEKRSKEYLKVQGIALIEDDDELHCQSPWKRDMHYCCVKSSRLAALPVGQGRGGDNWAVKGSTQSMSSSTEGKQSCIQEYITLSHLFQSNSSYSDQNYWNPWNPVDFFFVCSFPLWKHSGRTHLSNLHVEYLESHQTNNQLDYHVILLLPNQDAW